MQRLRHEHWVTLPARSESVLLRRLQERAGQAGFAPLIVQEAPDTATAISLVTAGVGLSLTLDSVAKSMDSPHVAYVPLTDGADAVDLLLLAASSLPPAASTVVDLVERAYEDDRSSP